MFKDFVRIFRDFAQIFMDFSRIFGKSKLFWVRLHPLHPRLLLHWFNERSFAMLLAKYL